MHEVIDVPLDKGLKSQRELFLDKREFTDIVDIEGVAVCTRCHAVHDKKRWAFDEGTYQRLAGEQPPVNGVLCPGCRAVEERRVAGILTLRSPQIAEHATEMLHRLQHEADAEKQKNALSRIIHIEQHRDEIVVQTTTIFLATRLGHAIHHAFHGELDISKPPKADFVRVTWHDD
jgi:NMD protein affecting ribosome stability and mRNA decay